MSEYNANDHLHNVTESVQRLTWQAQGVQDITGANVADYETMAPDAASSVTLVNARTGVPFLALINNLPPDQPGEGTPSLENVRPLTLYTKSVIQVNDTEYEVPLPDDFYGGNVDYVRREIISDILKTQLFAEEWTPVSGNPGVYRADIISSVDINVSTRYTACDKCVIGFGSISNITPGGIIIYAGQQYTGRVYYMIPEGSEIASADDLKAWLEDNPIYMYYHVNDPQITPYDSPTILYVSGDDTITAEDGTLTVKYQGIAPDEP